MQDRPDKLIGVSLLIRLTDAKIFCLKKRQVLYGLLELYTSIVYSRVHILILYIKSLNNTSNAERMFVARQW